MEVEETPHQAIGSINIDDMALSRLMRYVCASRMTKQTNEMEADTDTNTLAHSYICMYINTVLPVGMDTFVSGSYPCCARCAIKMRAYHCQRI